MADKIIDSNGYIKKILLARIYDLVKVTPLQSLDNLSSRLGVNVLLKREDYQKIHSFKLRGAYHKIKNLDETQLKAGIVTASAGNHAQGVALSAKKLGIKAVIVMPTTTPDLKIDAVRNFIGDIPNDEHDNIASQLNKLTEQVDNIQVEVNSLSEENEKEDDEDDKKDSTNKDE